MLVGLSDLYRKLPLHPSDSLVRNFAPLQNAMTMISSFCAERQSVS